MGKRQCSFCGAFNPDTAQLCSNCREPMTGVPHAAAHAHVSFTPQSIAQIRRGVIYILLAAGLHYLTAGESGFQLPVQVSPIVNSYLIPFMFLCGAGLIIYGLFRAVKS